MNCLLSHRWAACFRAMLALFAACLFMGAAQAQTYTCNAVTTSAMSAIYPIVPTSLVSVAGSVSITCTRSGGSGTTTRFFQIGADNGLQATGGGQRRAQRTTTSRINYNLFKDAGCSVAWANAANPSTTRLPTSLTFTANNVPVSSSALPYCMTLPSGQAPAVGTYTDTVGVTLWQGSSTNSTSFTQINAGSSSFAVTVTVPDACYLSSSPGAINFTYTSFQTAASTASTTFAVRCQTSTTYTLSLDATSGTINGLPYSLVLSRTGTITGTGSPQSTTITGTIAANLSGTCVGGCASTATRTLTVTY
jgi:spore coat protein U-like protein